MNTTRQKMKMPRWVKQQLAADVCILRSYATRAASDSHTHSSFEDFTRCHVRDRLKSTTATLDSSACQFMPLFLSS